MMKLSQATFPLSLLLLAGCASTGVDRAAYAVESMEEVQTELGRGVESVDAVIEALNVLAAGEGDMRQQYNAYSEAVDAMEDQANRVRGLRQDFEAREADFMSDWERRLGEIQSNDLRQRASERRDAAVQRFDELESKSDAARSTFDPWMTDVIDIRTYLQNDLNPSGVASLADAVERVNEGADSIKAEIDALVAELETMIEAIRVATPPPPEGSGS